MRNGWYKKGRLLSLVVVGFATGIFSAAHAQKLAGIDFNGGMTCATGPGAAGQTWGGGDVGMTVTFTIWFEGLSPLLSYGSIFCTGEKANVTNESFTYNSPEGWSDAPMNNSEDFPLNVVPSAAISSHWPNYKCYQIQSTDYSGTIGLTLPAILGTYQFDVAHEGPIYWLLDGPNTAYFLQADFSTGNFAGPGELCFTESSVQTGKSWGAVKQLFR